MLESSPLAPLSIAAPAVTSAVTCAITCAVLSPNVSSPLLSSTQSMTARSFVNMSLLIPVCRACVLLTFDQVCAVGRAQASSVYNTSRISRKLGVPVWADGGVAATGHIVKVRLHFSPSLLLLLQLLFCCCCCRWDGVFFLGDGTHGSEVRRRLSNIAIAIFIIGVCSYCRGGGVFFGVRDTRH